MIITEFQILLDLNKGNERSILKEHASWTNDGYFFVDSEDGQCYLFDNNGQLDDIKKIDAIYERYINKDIKKIVIPKCVKSIGNAAFCKCTSLTSIEIPDSVKSIGDWAFWHCRSLKSVVFKGKTMDQVKAMKWYPWGIKDDAIIRCS